MTDLLTIKNLNISFDTYGPPARVVENLNLSIKKGEILGLVGESGCGKSAVARSILRLLPTPPTRLNGQVNFDGENLLTLSPQRLRKIRGRKISMIFQEPLTSLNPVFTIGQQMTEVLRLHTDSDRHQARNIACEFLAKVRIQSPETVFNKYPHELSGGQRQRVMIAMELSCQPDLLIADEPTSALDVTVQNQILALLETLTKEQNISVLFITHDLGVVAQLCDRVAVMYAGAIAELAPVEKLFAHPAHPYTKGLLAAVPSFLHPKDELPSIPGQVPDLTTPPPGCRFTPRCSHKTNICSQEIPSLLTINDHAVACHNPDPLWKTEE